MTREDVKRLLMDIRDMDEQIHSKELQIETMKELACSISSPRIDGMPGSRRSSVLTCCAPAPSLLRSEVP